MTFFCIDCGLGYPTTNQLKRHVQDSHVEETVKCEVCGKECRNKSTLNNHKKMHTTSTCEICWKTMTRNKISRHKIECSGKTFSCEECDFFSNRKDKLKLHMKKHQLDENVKFLFQCANCQKTFKLKSLLEAHQNVHTKENSISCGLCSKVL